MSWNPESDSAVVTLVKEFGFDYIESVYSKLSSSYPVKAIQSIFYGSGINSLDNPQICAEHVKNIIEDCKAIGANVITFGSPTMRVGDKSKMHEFLSLVDDMISGQGVEFCVEPNASYYGAEYYTTLEEIVKDLGKYSNIKSMIDVGNSILEGKNPIEEYDLYSEYVKHIHFAAKDLNQIEDYEIYKSFYKHLLDKGFDGLITYEFNKFDNIRDNLYNFMYNIKGEK